MPTYITLANWTDQGRKTLRDSLHRADVAASVAEKFGGKFRDIHWTNGPYDVVVTIEAPDDETATSIAFAIEEAGNVRTTTMRAYTREETHRILERLP